MIYQKNYLGILFKRTRQLCIFIRTFQTAIFGAKMWLIPKKNLRLKYSSLGQHSILARKGTFLKKGPKKFQPPPNSICFLSVLHQNKALHNFHKREQLSIVERNLGLEYALKKHLNKMKKCG